MKTLRKTTNILDTMIGAIYGRNVDSKLFQLSRGLTFELGSTRFDGGSLKRDNIRNTRWFRGTNGGVSLIFGRLRSGGSVRILRFFGSGSLRGLYEVFGILLVLRFNVVDGPDCLQSRRPRSWCTYAIERLAGVNTEVGQGYRAYQKGIVGILLVIIRKQGQHAVTAPPGDKWPRPSHCVTMQSYRRVHRHRYASVRLSDDGDRELFRG